MARTLTPQVVAEICQHMNDDHADSVATYARVFGGCTGVRSARIAKLDAEGMELDVDTDERSATVHIAFDHALQDVGDARRTLVAMAQRAQPASEA